MSCGDNIHDGSMDLNDENISNLYEAVSTLKDVLINKESMDRIPGVIFHFLKQLSCADFESRQEIVEAITKEDPAYLKRMIAILSSGCCLAVNSAICRFLEELLSPPFKATRGDLLRVLFSLNATEALMKSLIFSATETSTKCDSTLLPILHVLAKVCTKDNKAALKMRLRGSLKVCHQLLQSSSRHSFSNVPLLHIVKELSKNASNQMAFGKINMISTMISLQNSTSKSQWLRQKLIFETIANLTKIKTNCDRFVTENGLPRVLLALDNWEKIDKKHQYKMVKALLSILSHLCDSKTNKAAVINQRGLEYIHKFASNCPSQSKLDQLFLSAIAIMMKCAQKNELPVSSLKRNVSFAIPSADKSSRRSFRELTPDSDSDEETDRMDSDAEPTFDLISDHTPRSTFIEDISRMSTFFPEYNDFKIHSASNYSSKGCSWKDNYSELSCSTRSVSRFVKLAYPDLIGANGSDLAEPLLVKDRNILRERLLLATRRALNPELYQEKVVFDLDFLLESENFKQIDSSTEYKSLTNWDEKLIGRKDLAVNHLSFESRFESGNLRRAIQVSDHEYDLILSPDINSSHHFQWFYFEVSNMNSGVPYVFNILNNEKPNSEFNYGMQPLLFSVTQATQGEPYWIRNGSNICYHKNHYHRPTHGKLTPRRRTAAKSFYTATFTITFQHANDICYIAYHYPYTYSKLQTFLSSVNSKMEERPDLFYANQVLCKTLNGNNTPILTITDKSDDIKKKPVIFLSARVHPGESNASLLMQGTIETLISDSSLAESLRQQFVFKIVPMLNPEGVINGNQRCGLTDEDLNRRWIAPNATQHPTIYSAKAVIEYLDRVLNKKPMVFCDFHGHSRQKNIFMYGCSPEKSWWVGDRKSADDDTSVLILPQLAQNYMPTFSYNDCSFQIERARESTARVAVWRQFSVPFSFTMEVSTSGCDRGSYANLHLNTRRIMESGEGFCEALHHLPSSLASGILKPDFPVRKKSEKPSNCEDQDDSDSEMDFEASASG